MDGALSSSDYASVWLSPMPYRLEVAQQPDEGDHTTTMVNEVLTVTSRGHDTTLTVGKEPVEKKVNFGKLIRSITNVLLVSDVLDNINVSDTITVRSPGKKTIHAVAKIATLIDNKMVIIRECGQIVAVFEFTKEVAFLTGTQLIKTYPVRGQQYDLVIFQDHAAALVGEPVPNYNEGFEFDKITCCGGNMNMTGPGGLDYRMARCSPGELAYFRVMHDSIALLDGFGAVLATRKFDN